MIMQRYLVLLCLGLSAVSLCRGQAALSVTPAYAVITRDMPHGIFTLRNNGTESVEVVIRARYGVIATQDSTTEVVLDKGGHLGDLSQHLIFFPDRSILAPGDERVVRYMVDNAARAEEKGHITLMHFEMQERAVASLEQVPVVASALSIVYNLVAPLVFINGESRPVLAAELVDVKAGELIIELTAQNAWPFLGGVTVTHQGMPLQRIETAVYTRRRVLFQLPTEPLPDRITLLFDSDYTGMTASVRRQLAAPPSVTLTLLP